MNFKLRSFLPLVLAAAASAGVAHADTFTGIVYSLPTGTNGTVVAPSGLSYATGSKATSTFTVGNIDFNSPAGGPATGVGSYTVGGFLSNGGTDLTVNSTLAAITLANKEIVLTGSTYLVKGMTYTFNHDDGMVLDLGESTVIDAPSPTVSENSSFTYNGATGMRRFTLEYGENGLAPADLTGPFTAATTPEPSSIMLMGSGLLSLAGVARRRFKK